MAANSAELIPGGGGMPPGVVLCACATLVVVLTKQNPSRMRIRVARFICPQTMESLSIPNIPRDKCS